MARLPALAAALVAAATPALAQDGQVLRLLCRPDQSAMAQPLGFSIDFAAKDAVETTTGQRFALAGERDTLLLTGPATFRIDRVSGRFIRTDTNLRLEGTCEKEERKF